MRYILLLMLLLLIIVVTSGIGKMAISGADAVRNISLTKVAIDTEPLPVVTIFTFNELARMEDGLNRGEVRTKAQSLKDIFIFGHKSTVRTTLRPASIPTTPKPLMRPFVLHEGLAIESKLSYPGGLIGDGRPPILSEVAVANLSTTSAEIQWVTNENSDSFIVMGTAPTNLSDRLGSTLLDLNHSVVLTGLLPGTAYYCQATSTDRDSMTGSSDVLDLMTPG